MNQVTIIGNLTADPEKRTTTTGKDVTTFTVAVNRRQRDANGNSVADFFRVSAWNELAKNCAAFLKKGNKVCVVGSVSIHTYTRNDGSSGANMEVMAQSVEFLTPKNNSGFTPVDAEDNPFG